MNAPIQTSNLQSSRGATESRILALLSEGHTHEIVASATGVSVSYISQLLSQEDFKKELLENKFHALQKHNERDARYDTVEDKLLKQFEGNMCLLQKPMEILKAMQVVNGLKRRGSSAAPEHGGASATTVNLLMPTKVVQTFTTNINNQVVNIGEKTLETMQSSTLLSRVKNEEVIEISQSANPSEIKMLNNSPSEVLNHESNITSNSARVMSREELLATTLASST